MRYVILGVGAAGITAAKTIREMRPNDTIVMISKDEFVHSRCMLHKYLSHERNEEQLSFIEPDFFDKKKIEWIKGLGAANLLTLKKVVVLEDGQEIGYDKLLIATGANSFIPPVGQLRTAKNVFGLRHLSDAQAIRPLADTAEHIVIIGSGLVGMDAAYAFLENGKKVTVIEMMDRILPIQLNEKAGAVYRKSFEEHGCTFLTSKKVVDTHTKEDGSMDEIILEDGGKIPCDLVLVAAGVRSAMEFLQDSGIKADRAIAVSNTMQTSDPNIYAAGDVTGLSGIWPNAMKQGQIAAYNMCQMQFQYLDTYAMKNTMNFYGVPTLSLGTGRAEEGDVVLEREDAKTYQRAVLRNGKLDSILLQGDISHSGIYQYLIKNGVDLSNQKKNIFDLSFADFYGIDARGMYQY